MTTSNAKQYVSNAHQKLRDNWEDGDWLGAIIPILCFSVLFGLIIKTVYTNVEPFVYLFGEDMPAASKIPIIGAAWDVLNVVYLCFGAFASWGFVNTCEIIWIFIALDSKAHRSAMRAMQAEQALQEAQSEGLTDTSYTRRLKRKGLKIPFFFIEFSPVIALAGLTVDIIVNWHRYPVITSWSKFWGGLLIGRVMGVDWSNLKSIAWNLTSLEILVVLLIVCWQWIQAHRSA
jgi:hypothetical protein